MSINSAVVAVLDVYVLPETQPAMSRRLGLLRARDTCNSLGCLSPETNKMLVAVAVLSVDATESLSSTGHFVTVVPTDYVAAAAVVLAGGYNYDCP